jgi:putative ABC transport system permease protein
MSLTEAWRVAIDALRASRLRSALTMVGVIVGVAAVVILVAIGTGAKQKVEQQVEGLGSNLLLIVPGQVNFGAAPTVSRLRLDDVEAVTRVVGDRNRVAVTTTSGETVRAGNRSTFASVAGVLDTTPKVFVRNLARGAYLTRSDVDTGRRVAVLGATVADKLFGEREAVGSQITLAGVRFRVVGVFAPIGQSLGVDRDNEVHIPITTAQRVFDTSRIDAMAVKAPDRTSMDEHSRRIIAVLH